MELEEGLGEEEVLQRTGEVRRRRQQQPTRSALGGQITRLLPTLRTDVAGNCHGLWPGVAGG